jgi:diacylglycerol diphosphate phosphatase/phosphatidate phosphatase
LLFELKTCSSYGNSFFAGQLHVFRPRTGLARFLFAVSPLFGALLIATSRLADYRHDVYDVTCGSLLGFLLAYFIYQRYFPPFSAPDCDTPYSRGELQALGFRRVAQDEERQLYTVSPSSPEDRDRVY